MALEYPADEKQRLLQAIEAYWQREVGEDIGLIRRESIFEFFNGLLGTSACNKGVRDARTYLQAKLIDLEIDLSEEVRFRSDA